MSLPSRERGLKLNIIQHVFVAIIVAPLAGAWIEIDIKEWIARREGVAPLAGAWIEILCNMFPGRSNKSRSPRGSVD